VILHSHSRFPVKPFVPKYFNVIFRYKILKYLFCGMWLEYPHGSGIAVNGWGSLPFISIFGPVLPFPGFRVLVMVVEPLVEFSGDASYNFFFSGVCKAQTTRTQSPQMDIR